MLYHRAVGIYALQEIANTSPSSPIDKKAASLMQKHLNLLNQQTAMWLYVYLSKGLQTYQTNIPGLSINTMGIVHFKTCHVLDSIQGMLNTFEDALGASVLLNTTDLIFLPFIQNLQEIVKFVLTTKNKIEVVVNDVRIEEYAPSCFQQVAEYGSSLSIVVAKETNLYNKLPFILKICEYISMHVLSIHDKDFIKLMPQRDKLLHQCQADLFIPNNKSLLKAYIGVGKLKFTLLFGQMLMPLIKEYLQSFTNIEQLLSIFELTDLDALETYMIEWQDTLMALNLVDIQYGDFIPNLASLLTQSYAEKDRQELLQHVSLLFKTPPTAYRLTDQDKMFIKRILPKSHSIKEFRNYTKATLEAYSEYKETINDEVYELPNIIISGQAKTVVSICHELMKQFAQDPIANKESALHCKDLLNNIRHLLYNKYNISSLTSACIAFNDTNIYVIHHIILLEQLLQKGQSNCMSLSFKLTFMDLVYLFKSRGKEILQFHFNRALNAVDNTPHGAMVDMRNTWHVLADYLSEHQLYIMALKIANLAKEKELPCQELNTMMADRFASDFYKQLLLNQYK